MTNNRCYSPSYGWKSIISARPILERGLIKYVGSGNTISAWNDNWIMDEWPRPAKSRGNIYPTNLMVNHMIDPITREWNLDILHEYFSPTDIPLIQAIPICKNGIRDKIGWAFTKSGKYTVKSGYWVAHNGNYGSNAIISERPNFDLLLSHAWKLHGPSKIKHFIWQAISGCLAVNSRLKSRGIDCNTKCPRCGIDSETINHALFECPPSFQTWVLSDIPSAPDVFPTSSLWRNMDYLFWRIPEVSDQDMENKYFLWILWFIWKSRNDMVHKNITRLPPNILSHAQSEATAWQNAQQQASQTVVVSLTIVPTGYDKVCQIDGSWKKDDLFSGLGWCCVSKEEPKFLLGAKGQRRSLSPLHTELEALIWAMECMMTNRETSITFQTDSRELVEMVNDPMEWPAFSPLLADFLNLKVCFNLFDLSYCPRSLNTKADCLANSARHRCLNFSFVSCNPPVWLTKPFI